MIINGAPQKLDTSVSLIHFLKENKLDPTRIAVELNGHIIPKSDYGQTVLQDNDELEIVHFVGGG